METKEFIEDIFRDQNITYPELKDAAEERISKLN